MMHVTRLVPMLKPTVCAPRFAMLVSLVLLKMRAKLSSAPASCLRLNFAL
jgi:hypothetical protein